MSAPPTALRRRLEQAGLDGLHAPLARMASRLEADIGAALAGRAPESPGAVAELRADLEARGARLLAAGTVTEAQMRGVTALLRIGRDLERVVTAAAPLIAGRGAGRRREPLLRHLEGVDRATEALLREAAAAIVHADAARAALVARDRRAQRAAETALRALITETIADPRRMAPTLTAFDRVGVAHEIAEYLCDACSTLAGRLGERALPVAP